MSDSVPTHKKSHQRSKSNYETILDQISTSAPESGTSGPDFVLSISTSPVEQPLSSPPSPSSPTSAPSTPTSQTDSIIWAFGSCNMDDGTPELSSSAGEPSPFSAKPSGGGFKDMSTGKSATVSGVGRGKRRLDISIGGLRSRSPSRLNNGGKLSDSENTDLSGSGSVVDVAFASKARLQGGEALRKIAEAQSSKANRLELASCELRVLPVLLWQGPGVGQLDMEAFRENLTELVLSTNQLTVLPGQISLFVSLKLLDLSFNLLSDLPNELGEMKSLQVLQLAGNPLKPVVNQKYLEGLPTLLTFLRERPAPKKSVDNLSGSKSNSGTQAPSHPIQTPQSIKVFKMRFQIAITTALSSVKDEDVIKLGELKDDICHNKVDYPHLRDGVDKEFTFRDYGPTPFHAIRLNLGITNDAYLSSLIGGPLRELGFSGKSGSSLYITHDQRYIIKTISSQETQFLRKILYAYYKHLKTYPGSFLCKIVGLHKVPLSPIDSQKVVVMTNVFATTRKIHQRYDLKGSTVGRQTIEVEKTSSAKRRFSQIILKDQDIKKSMKKFQLGLERKKLFQDQLAADCKLLAGFEIIDYSLIIGVHFLDNTAPKPVQKKKDYAGFPDLEDGGICSMDDNGNVLDEVFYLAIIDFLQPYNIRKHLEHSLKGIRYDKNGISIVPPLQYADRFQDFITTALE